MKFNLSDFYPKVADLENSINNTMASFGFEEKLVVQSEAPVIELTSNRLLLDVEKEELKQIINLRMSKMTCVEIRLKTG